MPLYFGIGKVKISSNGASHCLNLPNIDYESHVIDGDKLIVRGAFSMIDLPEGLYLDCEPSNNVNTFDEPYYGGK